MLASQENSTIGSVIDSNIPIAIAITNNDNTDAVIEHANPAAIVQEPQSLEFFHNNLDLSSATLHVNLKSLAIVAQPLKKIYGLEHLKNLGQLWICETGIKKIEGLQDCTQLKKLFLYSNEIDRIDGLQNNLSLETLWLSDNKICHIENLQHLSSLKELNLANNQIRCLGKSLNVLRLLETLNISGNLLYSLTDIFHLQDLKNLKTLIINSPDYKEMSVTSIPHYCSIISFYFKLDQIDGIKITDESRELVKIAIDRRQCYYQMRIQSINRNRHMLNRIILQHTIDQYTKIETMLKKSIDSALLNPNNYILDEKIKSLLSHHESELQLQTSQYLRLENEINATCDSFIRLFHLEYQLAGLIQILAKKEPTLLLKSLEKYTSSIIFEFKYNNERYHQAQQAEDNLSLNGYYYLSGALGDLVTVLEFQLGIHSRPMLRQPAKEFKLDKSGWLLILSKPVEDQMIPYGVQFNQLPNGLQCRYLIHYQQQSGDEKCSNGTTYKSIFSSLTKCEFLQEDKLFTVLPKEALKGLINRDELVPKPKETDAVSIEHMLVKHKAKLEKGSNGVNLHRYTGSIDLQGYDNRFESLDLSYSNISKISSSQNLLNLRRFIANYSNLQDLSILKYAPGLVELEAKGNRIASISSILVLSKTILGLAKLDLRFNEVCLAKNYHSTILSSWPGLINFDGTATNYRFPTQTSAYYLSSAILPLHEFSLSNGNTYKEHLKPILTANVTQLDFLRISILVLDGIGISNLVDVINSVKWVNVKILSLRSNFITSLDCLDKRFPILEKLSLEDNLIQDLASVDSIKTLKILDVSKNKIQTYSRSETGLSELETLNLNENRISCCFWLPLFKNLKELFICSNSIKDQHQIHLLKKLTKLLILDLCGNQVYYDEKCKLFTIYHLPTLKILNSSLISAEDVYESQKIYYGQLTMEFLFEKLGRSDLQDLVSLDLSNCNLRELAAFRDGLVLPNLQSLNISFNQISCIDDLFKFKKLRSICANNNAIHTVQIISSCAIAELRIAFNNIDSIRALTLEKMPQLQILDLQGNRLKDLDFSLPLPVLKILNLDKNFISSISTRTFSKCMMLETLSLRENRLRQIYQLGCLMSLKLLALSNNRIQDVTEFSKLQCSNLLDLTFSANPIETEPFVKYYIITFLPNLQRINGKVLTQADFEKAKEIIQNQQQQAAL